MNNERTGTFSSSSISKLMSNGRGAGSIGKPFTTYVEEKSFEKKLGRELQKEESAKPLRWGHLAEWFAFQNLGIYYKLTSKARINHLSIDNWSGVPDCLTSDSVVDIKSCWTLKAFCQMEQSFKEGLDAFKKLKPEYYWQLVSNGILSGKDKAELILYIPFKSELEAIKDFIGTPEFFDLDLKEKDYYFINFSEDEELPFLNEGGHYNNITKFSFDIPEEDKKALIERVKLANVELQKLTEL
tara:strand:+ start:163 stop:888 length:726 start_codon:yes stop_codon:yes gene_type:complete